jgi:hypothetical protein
MAWGASVRVHQRRKRRRRFRCGKKWGYPSRDNAASDASLFSGRAARPLDLEVYHCGRCGGWHVGRPEREYTGH